MAIFKKFFEIGVSQRAVDNLKDTKDGRRKLKSLKWFAQAMTDWANSVVAGYGVDEAERQLTIGATAGMMHVERTDECDPKYIRAASRAIRACQRRRLHSKICWLLIQILLTLLAKAISIRITLGYKTSS